MSDQTNEPDILAGYNASDSNQEIQKGNADLVELSEEDFEARYKASKKQYRALVDGIKILQGIYSALCEVGPLEIDGEVIDAIAFLIEDFVGLLDQMFMASYWSQET